MSSGGLWSWPSRPCEWLAKRLRGRPVSRTVTLRRARPSCRAPARPAKLPPMMMTSSMVMGSVLWMDGTEDLLMRDLHLVGDAEHDGRRESVRTTGGVAGPVSDLDDPCPLGASVVDQVDEDRILLVVDDRGVILARRAVGVGGLHQPIVALDEGVDLGFVAQGVWGK